MDLLASRKHRYCLGCGVAAVAFVCRGCTVGGPLRWLLQALGYTPPAVSQHVALLEREVGCELLVRGARGVRVTPAGEVLRSRAERLLADAHLAELAVRETAGQLRSLRVGAFPSAAQYLLPDALEGLASAHPDLELTLLHFEPPDGLAQLAAGDVDAVVTHRYPGVTWSAPTDVRLRPVLHDPLTLIVPQLTGSPVRR